MVQGPHDENIARLAGNAASRHAAPEHLRRTVLAALEESATPARPAAPRAIALRAPWWAVGGWLAAGACALLLAAPRLGWQERALSTQDVGVAYLETHARALVTDHLIDVVSTDRHTVKPWFRGRVDFAPPVPDLAAQGFPLAGGRVDYVQRQLMAVAVYQRRQHVIDVYIAPAAQGAPTSAPAALAPALGYEGYSWGDAQWRFVAVADLDREELGRFVEEFRSALQPSAGDAQSRKQ